MTVTKAMKDEYPVMVTSFKDDGIAVSFNSLGSHISAGLLRRAEQAQFRALKSVHAKLVQQQRIKESGEK